MKTLLPVLLVASLGAGFLPAKTRNPDVLVVADAPATPDVVPQPTADKPLFYIFLGVMERDIGGSIAGLPSPSPLELRALLARELARHHYIETKLGGPLPQLAILCAWGTAALDTFEQYDSDTGESTTVAFNDRELYGLLGFSKVHQRMISGPDADHLNDALNSDRFYILVAALDALALQKRQKKLVWRTRISIDARRTTLPESMGIMLASAGPFFGKEESRPIVVDDALRRDVQVEVGEATVIENTAPDPKGK